MTGRTRSPKRGRRFRRGDKSWRVPLHIQEAFAKSQGEFEKFFTGSRLSQKSLEFYVKNFFSCRGSGWMRGKDYFDSLPETVFPPLSFQSSMPPTRL